MAMDRKGNIQLCTCVPKAFSHSSTLFCQIYLRNFHEREWYSFLFLVLSFVDPFTSNAIHIIYGVSSSNVCPNL